MKEDFSGPKILRLTLIQKRDLNDHSWYLNAKRLSSIDYEERSIILRMTSFKFYKISASRPIPETANWQLTSNLQVLIGCLELYSRQQHKQIRDFIEIWGREVGGDS